MVSVSILSTLALFHLWVGAYNDINWLFYLGIFYSVLAIIDIFIKVFHWLTEE